MDRRRPGGGEPRGGRRRRGTAAVAVAWLALAAAPGARAEPAPAPEALRQSDVIAVITAMRALAPVVSKNRTALERYTRVQTRGRGGAGDPCQPPAETRKLPGYADAERVIKENGFVDGEQYCRTSLRVFAACGVVRADQERPDWRQQLGSRGEQTAQARAQITRMLRELDGETDMADAQKQQLRTQLTQMLKELDNPEPNPLLDVLEDVSDADKAAAAPHCADLERLARELGR